MSFTHHCSVCKHGVQQLRQDFDQAIDQWMVHLRACMTCVKANGRHFEHLL